MYNCFTGQLVIGTIVVVALSGSIHGTDVLVSMKNLVIVVWRGDVRVFSSVREPEIAIEPTDANNDECTVYDAQGHPSWLFGFHQ